MMKLADFDGIMVKASKDTFCHELDVIYSSRKLKAIELSKFLNKTQSMERKDLHPYTKF